MKRFLSMLLALAMVLSMVPALGNHAHAATTTDPDVEPFYGVGWSDINRSKFSNMDGMIAVSVEVNADNAVSLKFNGKTDLDEMAASL